MPCNRGNMAAAAPPPVRSKARAATPPVGTRPGCRANARGATRSSRRPPCSRRDGPDRQNLDPLGASRGGEDNRVTRAVPEQRLAQWAAGRGDNVEFAAERGGADPHGLPGLSTRSRRLRHRRERRKNRCHQLDGGSLAGNDCLPHSSTMSQSTVSQSRSSTWFRSGVISIERGMSAASVTGQRQT